METYLGKSPGSLEVVSLDAMDGVEFQRFVAHLFEKLRYGKTEEILTVGDAGRDILIRSPDGQLVVIECKHHPKGTIGRPVVQKLHSAIITANAQKGLVVTTGRFSSAAIKYAEDLGSLVDLVDSHILYDLADRVGIKLLRKGEKTDVYHLMPPSNRQIRQEILAHLFRAVRSSPHRPHDLTESKVKEIHFIPAYSVKYRLHEDFSTSVGRIHSIHLNNGSLLLSGENGQAIQTRLARLMTSDSMVAHWQDQGNGANVTSGSFKLGYSVIKRKAFKQIQVLNTSTVSYYGANNVRYTKKCVPHVSKILVQSITQVYLPIIEVDCSVLTRRHHFSLCGNQREVDVLRGYEGNCEICKKELKNDRLLCNSCGRIVCTPGFMGHSYLCEECGKTICKECTYWTRKHLLLKKKMCEECAADLEKKGKRIARLAESDRGRRETMTVREYVDCRSLPRKDSLQEPICTKAEKRTIYRLLQGPQTPQNSPELDQDHQRVV